jgi:hypothetical protein
MMENGRQSIEHSFQVMTYDINLAGVVSNSPASAGWKICATCMPRSSCRSLRRSSAASPLP